MGDESRFPESGPPAAARPLDSSAPVSTASPLIRQNATSRFGYDASGAWKVLPTEARPFESSVPYKASTASPLVRAAYPIVRQNATSRFADDAAAEDQVLTVEGKQVSKRKVHHVFWSDLCCWWLSVIRFEQHQRSYSTDDDVVQLGNSVEYPSTTQSSEVRLDIQVHGQTEETMSDSSTPCTVKVWFNAKSNVHSNNKLDFFLSSVVAHPTTLQGPGPQSQVTTCLTRRLTLTLT